MRLSSTVDDGLRPLLLHPLDSAIPFGSTVFYKPDAQAGDLA